jgi:hypothetical protein
MLNSDHTTQRRYYIGVKNVGTISCSGTVLLNYLDPWNTNPLPVNLYPQQTDAWCWAASGEMVMSYLGGMVSQCEQANRRFAHTDCCNTPTPASCNQGGWPEFDSGDKQNEMRCKKILVSISAWMMLTGTAVIAGDKTTAVVVDPAAQAAALQVFKAFGGQTGQRPVGMPAADRLDKAALGDPLAVKMVRLDELQNYQPASGTDAAALLHDLQTVVYPIRVAGKVNGEMVMGKVAGAWTARSFAGPAHIQAVENVRSQLANAGVPAGSTMLVRVPALNIELVAYRDAMGMKLTPVTDLAAAGLTAGQTLPASRVFEQLLPLALQHNGMPF